MSRRLINEERVSVARRTQERIAELFSDNEECSGQENKETQTDCITNEDWNWNFCLNAIRVCVLVVCMNLLFLLTVAVP
jgi:hypothetical protein